MRRHPIQIVLIPFIYLELLAQLVELTGALILKPQYDHVGVEVATILTTDAIGADVATGNAAFAGDSVRQFLHDLGAAEAVNWKLHDRRVVRLCIPQVCCIPIVAKLRRRDYEESFDEIILETVVILPNASLEQGLAQDLLEGRLRGNLADATRVHAG